MYTLILGGIVDNSIYEDTATVVHVVYVLAIWSALIFLIEFLVQKKDKNNSVIKGQSAVLVWDGELSLKELKDNYVEIGDGAATFDDRIEVCYSLKEVKHVILEVGGNVTVYKNVVEESNFSYLLVDDREIEKKYWIL